MDQLGEHGTYSLTPMQKGMLFQSLANPRSGTDIEQVIGTLHESLDLPAFRKAWQRLVDRHEALRMRFLLIKNGSARQFPLDRVTLTIDEYDWSMRPLQEQKQLLETFLNNDRVRGFNPRTELLIRVAVFRFDELDYRFVFTWWHGILDGRARLILLEELFLFYDAFREGEDISLPLPRRYTDYTEWLAAHDMTNATAYWRELLQGFGEPTPVGTHQVQNGYDSGDFGVHEFRLPQSQTTRLQSAVMEYGVTMNTLLQGAWALVLSQFCGEDDVVFGTTRACRWSAFDGDGSGEGIVGELINTVPVRVKIQANARVLDWLLDLRKQHIAVRPYENSSLVAVQACSGVSSDQRLFNTIVVYENQLLDSALHSHGGGWVSRKFETRGQPGFPITVFAYGEPSLLLGIFNERAHIDDSTAERMLGYLVKAIQSITENPGDMLTDIPLMPDDERQLLMEEWNRTELPFPEKKTIHHCFEEQVDRTPEAPALTCRDKTWTYRELENRAEKIARQLRAMGARPETIIGICMERCLDLVAGMLGILKTGAAYLPLDPTYPFDRLAFMVEDARPLLVVSNQSAKERLSQLDVRILSVDGDIAVSGSNGLSNNRDQSGAGSNLAYVIYTSGSTGKPKGVMVEHRNVMNLFAGIDAVYGRKPGVCLAVTSISFDPSVLDIFWTLVRGYHVVILPGVEETGDTNIPEIIRAHKVSYIGTVPSFIRMVMMLPGGVDALASMRLIQVGGEPLSTALIHDLGPSISRRIVNAYGPTEATVISTVWEVDPKVASIPIGRPVANTKIFVLDSHLRPVPVGVVGELYIGGAGVARGYLNRPELTAQKFIKNTFRETASGYLYRTGDLVRYRPDGMLEFIGRMDDQVKIRGFRVELGEIVTVLGKHPDIIETVVDVQDTENYGKRLVAYVVPGPRGMPSTKDLRQWVGQKLPVYMVPAVFISLNEIPRTSNGKIDRHALPQPAESENRSGEFERTPTSLETKLIEIWCEVLRRRQVGLDENFFDLGGDSLTAVAMIVAIEERLGVKLPLEVLLNTQTVEQLADYLKEVIEAERIDVRAELPGSIGYGEPQSMTERRLQAIWERLLDVRPIGIYDSFFDLGGNSSPFDRMVLEIRAAFGVFTEGLPINEVLRNPTIEALARMIDGSIEPESSLVVPLQPNGYRPPLFLIHAGGGYVFFYRALASRLGWDRPVYAVRAETSSDNMGRPFHKSKSVEEVAARYITEIKTIQPRGPYLLGGACVGGVIAFEMARQLQSQGEENVGPLLIFDAFVMNNPHISKEEQTTIFQQAGILPPETLLNRANRHFGFASKLGLVNAVRYIFGKIFRKAIMELGKCIRWTTHGLLAFPSLFAGKIECNSQNTDLSSTSVELMQRRLMDEFMIASARLQSKYVPSVFEGSLVLFKAKESTDPEPLWQSLAAGGLIVHQMPGVHLDMMEEPAVINTAALIGDLLHRAHSPTGVADRYVVGQNGTIPSGDAVSIRELKTLDTNHMNGRRVNSAKTTSALASLSKLTDIWEHSLLHRCINVAARLGIADFLVNGGMSIEDLAKRTGSHAPTLYRVLRLLCAHNIFNETEDSKFTLTPIAECLRSDVPWSLRWGSVVTDCHERAGAELFHAVRGGECPFEKATGISFWTYLSNNAEASDWFNLEMQSHNYTLNIPALLALDWKHSKVVVDVGGGTGQALSSVLQANPHLKGILVGQPQVIDRARAVVKSAGIETRCKLEPTDIFKSVPSGADTYILARVLHDWDDEHAVAILKVIRQAISAGGRLLLLEMIVPIGNKRHLSKAADISMLLLFGGGCERTEQQFVELLRAADFRLTRLEKGRGAANIIEAMPN